MIGRTSLEAGAPVRVLIRWGKTGAGHSAPVGPLNDCSWSPGGAPRNVLIERHDGSRVVRPFRGLRKVVESLATSEVRLHHRKEAEDDGAADREQDEQGHAEGGVFPLGRGFCLVDAHGAPPAPEQRMSGARGSRPGYASADPIRCDDTIAPADALVTGRAA